jgi:hypothetical protein
MHFTSKLDSALTLDIPVISTLDHNQSDLSKLMDSYGILEIARGDLIKGEITFDEYICLCEMHEVNIDSYLETIETNLVELHLL